MSASEPPEDPNAWNPDDTTAVPVGPEPEPTGAGGAGGAGGWGEAHVEPFAIAALVWAVVSIVIPVIGTIVAFVLAARAADLIRRSRGERTGTQYVTAARIVAGAVLALWIIGGIAFLALRDDGGSNDNVAVPTQPPSTLAPPTSSTSTTAPATTTTTHPPVTTTAPPPTITVIPPPPTPAPPTTPPTTTPPTSPTTTPPTEPPTSTSKPPITTTTTTPEQAAAKVQAKALQKIGDSNRGVPNDERVVVTYTPGKDLLVTWAIDNGAVGEHPTGTPTCTAPPTDPVTTTTTTTLPGEETTTTTTHRRRPRSRAPNAPPSSRLAIRSASSSCSRSSRRSRACTSTSRACSWSARIRSRRAGDDDVVQVLYTKATVQGNLPAYQKMFDVPPAEAVQCLNPAFDL